MVRFFERRFWREGNMMKVGIMTWEACNDCKNQAGDKGCNAGGCIEDQLNLDELNSGETTDINCLSFVSKIKKLDEKGRCCGQKPITYKRPEYFLYCSRCGTSFSPATGMQIKVKQPIRVISETYDI